MKVKYLLPVFLGVAVISFMGVHLNIIKFPIKNDIHVQYAMDLSNDNVLAGFSDNIFVGKVTKKIGNFQSEISPVTSYQIEVISNVKGEMTTGSEVRQYAGYSNGIFYRVEDDSLLDVGGTYMFFTRHYENSSWMLFSPWGHLKLDGKNNITSITERFERAVKNQVPFAN